MKDLTGHVVLGLSGGPDSVYLLHKLLSLRDLGQISLTCAHLDHGWRNSSDAAFCKALCKEHNVPLVIGHAKEFDLKYEGSKEELGRRARRMFFDSLDCDYIALAHHADDQQETFLWRIIRGTSLAGLSCMKKKDGRYVRPLLNTYKKEILDYLSKNKIDYITDPTNESMDFLRNRIRKTVIPALRACDSRFDEKFADTLSHLQAENDFLDTLSATELKKIFSEDIGNLELLKKLPSVLQNRVLIAWFVQSDVTFYPSKKYLDEVLRFLLSDRGGSHQLHTSWRLVKKKNQFWIEKS